MRASSPRCMTRLTSSAICCAVGRGRRSKRVNTSRSCDTVRTVFSPPNPASLQSQEPQSQQRQSHVVVPAHPTAHLIVAQPHFSLALLENLLDARTLRPSTHHFAQWHTPTGVAQVVTGLWLRFHRPPHHQPLVLRTDTFAQH